MRWMGVKSCTKMMVETQNSGTFTIFQRVIGIYQQQCNVSIVMMVVKGFTVLEKSPRSSSSSSFDFCSGFRNPIEFKVVGREL